MDNREDVSISFTNKRIMDWFVEAKNDENGLPAKQEFWPRFASSFGYHLDMCNPDTFYNKVNNLSKLAKKKRADGRQQFLDSIFVLPNRDSNNVRQLNAASTSTERELLVTVQSLKKESKDMKRKLESYTDLKERYEMEVNDLTTVRKRLSEIIQINDFRSNELKILKESYKNQQVKLNVTYDQLTSAKNDAGKMKSIKRQIATKDASISKKNVVIKNLCQENQDVLKKMKNIESVMQKMTAKLTESDDKLKVFRGDYRKLSRKAETLQEKLDEAKTNDELLDKLELEKDCNNLVSKVKELEEENNELEKLVEVLRDDDIITFANGRFTDEIRQVIMKLVSLNVSVNKVNDVIKAVLSTLTEKNVTKIRLPSDGARKRIMEEALVLAQLQVIEEMKNGVDGYTGNCLHGDGTTKYSRHFQNFQITTKSGKSLSFGLSEVADSDAATVLKTFVSDIDDLCDVLDGDKKKNIALLVTSIKNTMSDLGPVNPLCNALLKAYREELLPEVKDNWNELNESQQSELKEMGNFFCKLHLLSNFATETDKYLKDFENLVTLDDYEKQFAFNTKESSPTQLVRIACKAFHVRGSDECGVASHFNAYLRTKEVKSYFQSFIGNRFNILYYNAAALNFHKGEVEDFLHRWPEPNKLLKSVDELMKNKFNMACVRALGITDKVLTGPLWRIIENVENILAVTPYLITLRDKLDVLRKNALPVLQGSQLFDEGDELIKIHRDDLYTQLFVDTGDNEFEVLTCQALEVIFHAVLVIVERQAVDHLPGGKYHRPSEVVANSSANVPAHNKISESDFAIFDFAVRKMPNASVETFKTITMWARNKTNEWLTSKSVSEKEELMKTAREKYDMMKLKYAERRKNLYLRKEEILFERQNIKKISEAKAAVKKTDAVNNLIKHGVTAWISVSEARDKIKSIEVNKQAAVITAQLNFYKNVLLSDRKAPFHYFTKSKGGVQLSSEELLEKLIIVIAFTIAPNEYTEQVRILKSMEERDDLVRKEKKKMQEKLLESRFTREIIRRNERMLPRILVNPNLMINCKIKHKLKESKDDEPEWCDGEVTGIYLLKEVERKTVYSVKYPKGKNPNDIYHMPLLLDMEKRDLVILVESSDLLDNLQTK